MLHQYAYFLHIMGPFLLKLPYYHQNMTLVLDIFCFYKFYIFLHDNGQVYLSGQVLPWKPFFVYLLYFIYYSVQFIEILGHSYYRR